MKRIITVVVFFFSLVSCFGNLDDNDDEVVADESMLKAGTVAPDFVMTTADHPDGISLSSFKGRYVVLEFWASWCPDCRKITSDVKDLYTTYASDKIAFIGVSFDTDKNTWQKYVTENGMEWTQYSELKAWKETTISKAYNIKWIPTIYIVDREGKILVGSVSIDKIKAQLAALPKD